jgi:serine/threonine-protein kinase HipA
MSVTTSDGLQVDLPGQHVGDLQRDRSGRVSWLPDAEWEALDQRPRLGIAFLRKPGPRHAGTGLPEWFENLLPEQGSALRQRLGAVHGLRDADSYGLLRAIGMDLTGAVEISPHDKTTRQAGSSGKADGSGDPDVESGLAERLRFSLAGMQLKLSMSMANDRLVLPTTGPKGQWIVKLPGRDFPELPEVEKATMSWAKAAGFDVPTHFTVGADQLEGVPQSWKSDALTAFAIRRFDRREDGSKIHQEDLCQGLELLPTHKYGDSGGQRVSLDGALRFVADAVGEEGAKEMSRRIGFIIASGNGDAHLKNWSLLWGNAERPVLAPCYDFVATVSWDDRYGWGLPKGPTLALRLGGVRRFAMLDMDALSRHATKSGFEWAKREAIEGIQRAKDGWASIQADIPPLMRRAMNEHWRRVPILRTMAPSEILNS